MAQSDFYDRTPLFFSLISSAKARLGCSPIAVGNQQVDTSFGVNHPIRIFNSRAKAINDSLLIVTERLQKLTSLIRDRSAFSDPVHEINKLTYDIKHDLVGIGSSVDGLSSLMSSVPHGQDELIRKQIINDLKAKLATQSQSFTSVLEVRTQTLRAQHSRRAQLVGTARPNTHLRKRGVGNQGLSQRLLPGLTDGTEEEEDGGDGAGEGEGEGDALLGGRIGGLGVVGDLNYPNGVAQADADADSGMGTPAFAALLQRGQVHVSATEEDGYLAARADAVEHIRAAIEEVGAMYVRLHAMVQQQEEMAVRIDADVDEALIHVEDGHGELLRHLDSLSSGQWLLLKVLAIVLVFALFFVTVIA